MKTIKFERELKSLINKVRAYGIQHIQYANNPLNILENKEKREEFTIQVHRGFYLAQKRCILLLKQVLMEEKRYKTELKAARRERDKVKCDNINEMLHQVKYQEMTLRKVMDAIAWQIFNQDLSTMRRLYYGQEMIDVTDSNLDSEIFFVEDYMVNNPDSFVLISDLTSFVQIGDVVVFNPNEGIFLYELKDGNVNNKVFELLNDFLKVECPYYIHQKLESETEKFQEQFWRDIKQIRRNYQVMNTVNEGEGKDLISGLDVKIGTVDIILDTYSDIVKKLLFESNKKGYAISVVEECLLIGVYENGKFPSKAFNIWAECLKIKMPSIDFRQSMFEPLAYPIFLQSFTDKNIIDIVLGKKIVKFTIDIEKWLETFKDDGLTYRWMSKKETARINGKFKGKAGIFSLDGCGIEICNKSGVVQMIGEGIFTRMFTSLNKPSSIKKLLIESIRVQEQEDLDIN